jgi:polysaccharide export outer membrane protein
MQPYSIVIGPADLLTVNSADAPELNQTVRVESDGSVNLLLLGQVKLAGLTATQASQWIESELIRRNLQIHPHVSVVVTEYASQSISVTGEVAHPGVFPSVSPKNILDVISLAGGFTALANTNVTVKHRVGNPATESVNLVADKADDALAANIVVYPGDIVVVPRAGIIFVLGEVGRPGGIVMQDNGHITALQALAQAGGALYTSSANSGYLLHKGPSGYTTARLKLADLMKGNIPDFELAPNDILYVPPSRIKHLGEQTSGLVQTAAGAAIYHSLP